MIEFFGTLNGMDRVFFFCFAVGGLVFAIWTIIQFVAGGGHGDNAFDLHTGAGDVDLIGPGDVGGHSDLGGHGDLSGHGDTLAAMGVDGGVGADLGFQILSFQGLGAFGLMFGLAGLALHREMGASAAVATLGALVVGMTAIWALDRLMHAISKLQSSGTINLQNAVGEQGSVYLRIPGGGTGKVTVPIQGRLMTMDAVSENKEEIKSRERVEVVSVISGVLTVRKI